MAKTVQADTPKPTVPGTTKTPVAPVVKGNPVAAKPVEDFKDAKTLRDGSKASAEFTAVVTAENADDKVTTEAINAANFDEQALDPYEVSEAQREKAAQAAGRP